MPMMKKRKFKKSSQLRNKRFYQGFFTPKNPNKYKGNASKIIYRSSLELRLMNYLDKSKKVIKWNSEEFFIPYISPTDSRYHRYFPDFWVKLINKDDITEEILIEVKPYKQTLIPEEKTSKTGRYTANYLREVNTFSINNAKWEAAKKFCVKKEWRFEILTEKDLTIG